MTTTKNPRRFWSMVSGIALLIMAIAAGYAYGVSFNQIYVENNPAQTMTNIESNSLLFYSGALVWCLILVTDLIVSYGFYRYLKPAHLLIARLSGLLRLIYSILLLVGILFLFGMATDMFLKMWSLGLFIIGFHLSATGIGVLYSTETPKLLSHLLLIAGIGYSLINGLLIFTPQLSNLANTLETILMVPMTVGELSFGLWLLVKGGKKVNQPLSNAPAPDVL